MLTDGCSQGPIIVHDQGAPTRPIVAPASLQRPPAILDGQSIAWEALNDRMLELAGGQILAELALEQLLRQELVLAGLEVTDADEAAEEASAIESMDKDPLRAKQLLESLKSAQGLGQSRWDALLWRNAALRALARRASTITQENVRQAFDSAHGPRRICRIIVVPDIQAADRAKARLKAGESFGDVAALLSIDSSAARGGLLAPVTRLDPSYPPAFRETLYSLKEHEVSECVLLDNGYALIQFQNEIPGDSIDPASVKDECERIARRAQERVEMDRLAKGLMRRAKPTVFDERLEESWRRQLELQSTP